MKINVTKKILDENGKAISDNGKDRELTLRDIIKIALFAPDRDAREEEKIKRHDMYLELHACKKYVDWPMEDLSMLKKLIHKTQPHPWISVEACDLIEPRDVKLREEPKEEGKKDEQKNGK